MRKFVSVVLVMILCACLACQAFAAENEFLSSPGFEDTCTHNSGTKVVGAKDPTCTSEGYTGDIVCNDCGKVLEPGKPISKIDHKYDENGFCEMCGKDESNPKTGDNSLVGFWMVAMLVAAVGLVAVIVVYRKKFAQQ